MIHLSWDWTIFWAIAFDGILTGFVIGPQSWPMRNAARIRPPVALALAMGLSIGAAFFLPLAAFRIAAGGVAELQATVLYVVFAMTGSVGLWVRGVTVR